MTSISSSSSSSSPPPNLPPPNDDLEIARSIDASTQSWITSTLRETFLPYLFYLITFTSFSKLLRWSHPFLFRTTRKLFSGVWWALEKIVLFVSWSGIRLGLILSGLWILIGLGLTLGWVFIYLKPSYERIKREKPLLVKIGIKSGVYGGIWIVLRTVFMGRFLSSIRNWVVVGLIVWDGWKYVESERQRRTQQGLKTKSREVNTASTTTNDKVDRTDTTSSKEGSEEHIEDDDGGGEAERWARQVREEMLRDSLLRRGKGTTTTTTNPTNKEDGEIDPIQGDFKSE